MQGELGMEQGAGEMRERVAKATIGKAEVARAQETLRRYKEGKANLEARIIDNEQWYKLQHWGQIAPSKNPGDPQPTSAWLFNCIANKHADAMDNYPAPNVLAREGSDVGVAKVLSSILPVVLEQNQYEQTYSDMWWYKLKTGTGVTGVFWNPSKYKGLGDVDIRKVDLLNLFWEPGITDIQKSRHVFHVELVDDDLLRARYPQLEGALGGPVIDVAKYVYDDRVDTTEKTVVVDWYYKTFDGAREVLQYCKFCAGEVLYASENEGEMAARGFYDHGLYPFVLDTLFPEEGTPAGFGYVDVCKSPQLYIDKLDQVILKNAVMATRPRFFIRGDGGINEQEYADWEKDFVHWQGSGSPKDSVMQVDVRTLPDIYASVRNLKIEELKETSGNRDFSQGGTAQGVTAASAIAALQEAGSKLSRDMLKSSYRSFAQVNTLAIELIRQFYDEPRCFRVLGEEGMQGFVNFSNTELRPQAQGVEFGMEMGMREPVFDIRVTSQKSSPFSTVAQNERAKELYGMGFFNPQLADQAMAALDMMTFEGIDKVRQRVAQNGMLLQQVQMLQQQVMQLATIVDAQNGTGIAQGMMQDQAQAPGAAMVKPTDDVGGEVETNALGKAIGQGQDTTAAKARVKAARVSAPQ